MNKSEEKNEKKTTIDLRQLECSNVGGRMRYAHSFNDLGLELLVHGSEKQIAAALPEHQIEVTIQPGGDQEYWEKTVREYAQVFEEATLEARSDDLSFLLAQPKTVRRPKHSAATMENTVFVVLRRTRLGGTVFGLNLPVLVVNPRSNFAFSFPWAFCAAGFSMPRAGNPDLFLHLGSARGPIVSAGVLGGLAPDSVGFVRPPWSPFFPVFRVASGPALSILNFTAFTFGLP